MTLYDIVTNSHMTRPSITYQSYNTMEDRRREKNVYVPKNKA